MIAESRKCGGKLRLMDARKLCRIDVNQTRKIYNHLVSKELIKAPFKLINACISVSNYC
uniref:Uncharacterized protein n=1 Tax=Amphimedon queenslandica TaxID=400682 RepID=A0A1X7SQY8_AMPQE